MRFDGKRVIVTGGSGSLGHAVSIAFAREGARVAVHYHSDRAAAAATLDAMTGDGHFSVCADMTDAGQVRSMIDDAAGRLGGLDVLVNCAGIHLAQPICDTSYEEWQEQWTRTLAVNVQAMANVTWCAIRHMADGGVIVGISSRGAFRGEPEHPAYGASKAALNNFAGSMAIALAPRGIRVATVAPSVVQADPNAPYLHDVTPEQVHWQSPTGRSATPEDVANAVLFLASDEGAFATGAVLDLNGASYLRL
ncbi:MAG TPA: SDR family oxidoreductase [Actinomycetota bacterium]|nr:SDR family oxidoreductase [Actinomycetota bacterium]